MRLVRDFYERLAFAKTGITTTIHSPLKPPSPPIRPPIHDQAPRAGEIQKPRSGKIDNALEGLQTLQRNQLEKEIPRAKHCLQTYLSQLFSHRVDSKNAYIKRAKAVLLADDASRTVYRWLHYHTVRYYILNNLDQSQ